MSQARKDPPARSAERLFDAIRCGDMSAFDSAIDDGADPSAVHGPSGESALMVAAEHDRSEMLRRLLQQEADVNYATTTGWTALHHAVDVEVDASNQGGPRPDLRLVRALLEAGAQVDAVWQSNRGPRTPVDIARDYHWQEGVDAMRNEPRGS